MKALLPLPTFVAVLVGFAFVPFFAEGRRYATKTMRGAASHSVR